MGDKRNPRFTTWATFFRRYAARPSRSLRWRRFLLSTGSLAVAHTHTKLLYHVVFSTKERTPIIDAEVAADLHAHYGGVVREPRRLGGRIDSLVDTLDMAGPI